MRCFGGFFLGALAIQPALAATAFGQSPDIRQLWESVALQPTAGAKDLTWSPDGGFVFSNARRGGAEVEYLAVHDGLSNPTLWSAPTLVGDHDGGISASAGGGVVACLYAEGGIGGAPLRLKVRILDGFPGPVLRIVDLGILGAALDSGSFGVCVSSDGSSLRAWGYSGALNQTVVVTMNRLGDITSSVGFDLGSPVYGSARSLDGRTLVLQGLTTTRILTEGGTPPSQSIAQPGYVQGMVTCSANGNAIAWSSASGRVSIAQRAGDQTPFGAPVGFNVTPAVVTTAIGISGDASTLAVGFQEAATPLHVREHVYALDGTTASLVFQRVITTSYGANSLITDVDAGPNGRWIAFATTGSSTDALPELDLLQRNAGGEYGLVPAWSAQLAGSALVVSISPRGDKLAVLRSIGHVDSGTGMCAVALFDLDSDLRAHGVPRVGQTVRIEVDAVHGRRVVLYRSNLLANPAAYLGGMGTLQLASPILAGGAAGGMDDIARFDVLLAPGTFAPGTTHHFQALCLNPRRLTQQTASFTVVP